MLGTTLLTDSSKISPASISPRLLLLYFSASWCGPCKAFTPQLISWYNARSADEKVEIIFVSSDRSQDQFNIYFSSMPWLAIPYDSTFVRQSLSQRIGVRGLPSLVVIDPQTGDVISNRARNEIQEPECLDIWMSLMKDSSLNAIDDALNSINTNSTKGAEAAEEAKSSYLNPRTASSQELLATFVKEAFSRLTLSGTAPNVAAVAALKEAHEKVMATLKHPFSSISFELSEPCSTQRPSFKDSDALTTAFKYMANALKDRRGRKYRAIKLTNLFFNKKISTSPGAFAYLVDIGFEFTGPNLILPWDVDLEKAKKRIETDIKALAS